MNDQYDNISVEPLSGSIGAEIKGVYISESPNKNVISEIRRAFLNHNVIVLRDQNITSDQYMDFAEKFGEPSEYPFIQGLPGYPYINPIIKLEDETVNFGGTWHTDTAYLNEPPLGTMLLAKQVPPIGGDTIFANLYSAYEGLSNGLKEVLSGMYAIHSSLKADASKTREDRIKDNGRQDAGEFQSSHPVVRTHPETKKKALYINLGHTVRFDGWTEEESKPLLQYLYEHCVKPEFTCRIKWEAGSLVFWDNRCSLHNPINDYHGYRRVMHRITLKGDTPL